MAEGVLQCTYHGLDADNIYIYIETELSKYIWKLKEDGKSPSIKWSIVKRVNSTPNKSFCKLCLMEKLFIIKSLDDNNMLNKRSELISKCRHQNKTLLCNFKNDSND